MYNCAIKITTYDCEELSEILSSFNPPEDCTLEPAPAHGGGSPDSLCIYGSPSVYFAKRDNIKTAYRAVITDGNSVPPELFSDDAEIWVIPADCRCRRELLEKHLLSLINKIKFAFDYRIMKICLDTAADSSPDLIWYKDLRGAHLMVNDAFCAVVNKSKEQTYKKGHYYIWDIPKEEYEQGDYVCLESEDVVIKAGKTCDFDEKVKTCKGMRQFRTSKSPLYDVDGRLFGTCGVARDVTDLQKVDSELRVILESVPFGITVEDNDGTLISANAELKKYFPGVADYEGRDFSEWKEMATGEARKAGVNEFSVRYNGLPRILRFSTELIQDIFGETIGVVTIYQDMTAERIFRKQAIEHANTDFLTGLNNRRSLFTYLDKQKKTPQMSMITVDLDNFKKVNDTCGHKMGDTVLVQTSGILRTCFENDFIARLGGDEFLVVITRKVTAEELSAETQKLIDTFIGAFAGNSALSVMTLSAGISTELLPEGSTHNFESLMYSSDCALYESKKAGKSRFTVYKE